MRQNGQPNGRFFARLAIPPTPSGGEAHDAVQAVFLRFEQLAQRRRAILRLALVVIMVLAIFADTPRHTWPAQFALVGVYGVLAVFAAFLHVRRHPRASRLRAVPPMMLVDIAAICLLQIPSTGSYLMLGVLAFLPFFIATQSGRLAAVMSLATIAGGALVIVTDSALRREMSPLATTTVLLMLALLCLISYTISRTQQQRLSTFADLIASRASLLADVMTAEERERRRVAEALHDGPLQTLLSARQDLRAAIGPKADMAGVARASDLLNDVAQDLRQLTKQLHPSVLEEVGLEPAVRGLLDTLVERTGATVECSIDYPHHHPEDAMLYGVARELLTNVVRHANAAKVGLTLRDDGVAVTLEVRDDGVGIDPAAAARRIAEGHIGLASQRSRIETSGGAWEFEPVEQGTWVRVTLPLHDNEEVA